MKRSRSRMKLGVRSQFPACVGKKKTKFTNKALACCPSGCSIEGAQDSCLDRGEYAQEQQYLLQDATPSELPVTAAGTLAILADSSPIAGAGPRCGTHAPAAHRFSPVHDHRCRPLQPS